MSAIDMNAMLRQMQQLAAAAAQLRPGESSHQLAGTQAAGQAGFAGLLQASVEQVNRRQREARELQQAFELGEDGADLATVMIASAKSKVAFQTVLQVRNKLTSAYQEIMNMPL